MNVTLTLICLFAFFALLIVAGDVTVEAVLRQAAEKGGM